jgi:group I intron endonuclease
MGLIYKLTFSNEKVYIGQTKGSLSSRLKSHRYKSTLDEPKLLVHKAWKKYGEPSVEIIAEVSDDDLSRVEIQLISEHKSFGDAGYNLTVGGEQSPMLNPQVAEKVRQLALQPHRIAKTKETHLGVKRSDEVRKNISAALKGKLKGIPKSEEHKLKIGLAGKGKQHFLGKTHSDETKKRMSDAAKRRWGSRPTNMGS